VLCRREEHARALNERGLTVSGRSDFTATVQAALHERPMVVVYSLSPLTYRLGKRFLKVDTYAMPNLVAGRRIIPELIQEGFTPERVADETVSLLVDADRYARVQRDLRGVHERLGTPGASGRAADAILEVAFRRSPGSSSRSGVSCSPGTGSRPSSPPGCPRASSSRPW